tara:strand:+ start:801 stop:1376 length:576 start_codon:yes stop_codon:yes gene_type:complete
MIKIGLTGVIGSGKTTAVNYFKSLGVPVFIADDSAKKLMTNDTDLKSNIIDLLGENAYLGLELNKEFISDRIFNNKDLLISINNLVHPKVNKAYNNWLKEQNFAYSIYEAALIFENKSESHFDKIICIKTPLDIIHYRLKSRPNYSKNKINLILKNQISQDVKCSKSDFCIDNTSIDELREQINRIHISFK